MDRHSKDGAWNGSPTPPTTHHPVERTSKVEGRPSNRARSRSKRRLIHERKHHHTQNLSTLGGCGRLGEHPMKASNFGLAPPAFCSAPPPRVEGAATPHRTNIRRPQRTTAATAKAVGMRSTQHIGIWCEGAHWRDEEVTREGKQQEERERGGGRGGDGGGWGSLTVLG